MPTGPKRLPHAASTPFIPPPAETAVVMSFPNPVEIVPTAVLSLPSTRIPGPIPTTQAAAVINAWRWAFVKLHEAVQQIVRAGDHIGDGGGEVVADRLPEQLDLVAEDGDPALGRGRSG